MAQNGCNRFRFWTWVFHGLGDGRGMWRIVNWWLVVHAAVGVALAFLAPVSLEEAGRLVALPVSSALVGLSLAWVGAAHAILVTPEIHDLAAAKKSGIADYVYTFQLAVLVLLVTFALWCVCALQVFDKTWPTPSSASAYATCRVLMFALTSLALREGWHAVLGSQWLLLAHDDLATAARDQRANGAGQSDAVPGGDVQPGQSETLTPPRGTATN